MVGWLNFHNHEMVIPASAQNHPSGLIDEIPTFFNPNAPDLARFHCRLCNRFPPGPIKFDRNERPPFPHSVPTRAKMEN
jgi:hypothetical protein